MFCHGAMQQQNKQFVCGSSWYMQDLCRKQPSTASTTLATLQTIRRRFYTRVTPTQDCRACFLWISDIFGYQRRVRNINQSIYQPLCKRVRPGMVLYYQSCITDVVGTSCSQSNNSRWFRCSSMVHLGQATSCHRSQGLGPPKLHLRLQCMSASAFCDPYKISITTTITTLCN